MSKAFNSLDYFSYLCLSVHLQTVKIHGKSTGRVALREESVTKARQKLVSNEMFMREVPQNFSVPKTLLKEGLTRARNGTEDRIICSLSWQI